MLCIIGSLFPITAGPCLGYMGYSLYSNIVSDTKKSLDNIEVERSTCNKSVRIFKKQVKKQIKKRISKAITNKIIKQPIVLIIMTLFLSWGIAYYKGLFKHIEEALHFDSSPMSILNWPLSLLSYALRWGVPISAGLVILLIIILKIFLPQLIFSAINVNNYINKKIEKTVSKKCESSEPPL